MPPRKKRPAPRRKKPTRSPWPGRFFMLFILSLLVCGAYWFGRSGVPTINGMPVRENRESLPALSEIERMDSEALKRELARLRRTVSEQEKEIGELKMQLLVVTEGSRSGNE